MRVATAQRSLGISCFRFGPSGRPSVNDKNYPEVPYATRSRSRTHLANAGRAGGTAPHLPSGTSAVSGPRIAFLTRRSAVGFASTWPESRRGSTGIATIPTRASGVEDWLEPLRLFDLDLPQPVKSQVETPKCLSQTVLGRGAGGDPYPHPGGGGGAGSVPYPGRHGRGPDPGPIGWVQ